MHRNEPKKRYDDEVVIREIDSWEFSISPSMNRLYIDTTTYHTDKLALSREDLQALLNKMDEMIGRE